MSRLFLSQIILLIEALAIVTTYQVFSAFECRHTDLFAVCRAVRLGMVLGLCLAACLAVLLLFSRSLRTSFVGRSNVATHHTSGWAALHLVGLGLLFAPSILLSTDEQVSFAAIFLSALAVGGMWALVSGAMWLMPLSSWRELFHEHARLLLPSVAISLLIPSLAALIGMAWYWFEGLQKATFFGVALLLAMLGNDVFIDLEVRTIGILDFFVEVAETCSGIEGFALITAFMAIYALMMKGDLRIVRYWLIVWPVALLLSFALNVLRISLLILIGAHVSPELAVNGFHSFAGWLSFTLLSLLILTFVHVMPGLTRDQSKMAHSKQFSLTEDTAAAFIVPFLAFMLSGLIVHTVSQTPELWYGVQVGAMSLAIWAFRKPIFAISREIDIVACGIGALVGIGWLVTAQPGDAYTSLSGLGTVMLAIWIFLRIFGTAVLVPVVEEIFFRGYLFSLIDNGSKTRRLLAVIVTTAGFAALHGRPVAAAVAGVAFALVLLRRGKVFDAIVSHATANTLIAAAALATGQWALI